jgi:hypothetical protein
MTGVSWRRVIVALVAVAVGLGGTFVALRADGFAATDATVPRATRWFVHQATNRVVLADGFSGTTLARLDPEEPGIFQVVQSASGVALINRDTGTVRTVDAAALRLGPATPVELVDSTDSIVGIGQTGLVAVEPGSDIGVLLPPDSEAVTFEVDAIGEGARNTRIAPDGAVWTLVDDRFLRITSADTETLATGLTGARFTLVGNTSLLLDSARARVRFGTGDWVDLPDAFAPSEVVLQEPGPPSECGWIGSGDTLLCIGDGGVVHRSDIDGLRLRALDRVAIGGEAAVVVRGETSRLVRLDWRNSRLLDSVDDGPNAAIPAAAQLAISASVNLIWVDHVDGNRAWSIHPWGVAVVRKNDLSAPLLGESGQVIQGGDDGPADEADPDQIAPAGQRIPDGNGIDDPPVANPDSVSARFGVGVPIVVTANDYDPDGGAVAVVRVSDGQRGSVSITNASTVLYSPGPGFVGLDQFEYWITDSGGNLADTTVTVRLLPADAPNRAPVGFPDTAVTRPGVPVVIDVLANDVDPERDALQISSFTDPGSDGELVQIAGPTDLPALQYTPPPDISGEDRFTYRPVDAFGARGEPVEVVVEIDTSGGPNEQPTVVPDAVRLRRGVLESVPVLLNDRDPDNDTMVIVDVRAPDGFDVQVAGDRLNITALAGAPELATVDYFVHDTVTEPVPAQLLVTVVADGQPNQPPVASADTATVVVGEPTIIDVLRNDIDPDGDAIFLLSAELADDSPGVGTVTVQGSELLYIANQLETDEAVFERLRYTISDGALENIGEVTIRVLPERVFEPPFARDDSVTTDVDVAVTIDVLRNDGDPSGQDPLLVGDPSCPSGGVASATASGQVRYTPPAGRSGVFVCTYEVVNSQQLFASARITISVIEPPNRNRPPVVTPQSLQIEVGGTTTVDLLQNVTDPDGRSTKLEVVSWTRPAIGIVDVNGNFLTYTAPSTVGPPVAFNFRVSDGDGGEAGGVVTFTIVPAVPLPPIARDDRAVETAPVPPTVVNVLVNDIDPAGGTLRVTGARVTSGDGTASVTDSAVIVTPAATFVGDLVIVYEVTNARQLTSTATLVFTVIERPNRAPVVGDDVATVANGGQVVVAIANNDSDPDGDPLTYSITEPPNPRSAAPRSTGPASCSTRCPAAPVRPSSATPPTTGS